MSARDPLDRYYTPPPLADAVLQWVVEVGSSKWSPTLLIEPCSGGGAFQAAGLRRWPEIELKGCDLDPEAPSIFPRGPSSHLSVTDPRFERAMVGFVGSWLHKSAIIVTNPSYSILSEVLPALLSLQAALYRETYCAAPIVLLLRETVLSHLCDSPNPPDVIGLCPIRPAYEGPAGDLLLKDSITKAQQKIMETREKRISAIRDRIREIEPVRGNIKEHDKLCGQLEKLTKSPPRTAAVESYGSDSCGSALALWRPSRTVGQGRQWHPVPRWRPRGPASLVALPEPVPLSPSVAGPASVVCHRGPS